MVADAHVSAGALIRCDAGGRNAHASLFGRWVSLEAGRTLARRHVILQFAQRVRAAHILVARILAVVIVARFIRAAVAIAATTDDARALLARLSSRTLAVALALDATQIVPAVLAVGAVVLVATRDRALSVDAADTAVAVAIGGARKRVTDASILGEIRHESELAGTRADRFAIFDGALHVRAAQIVAFVDTSAADASRAGRAFVVAHALADRMAPGRFGEAGVAGRAFANVRRSARAELANGRLGAVRTGVGQFAADVGDGIATVAGRALAHGCLILSDADGIFAARRSVADVVARVRETVAQLRWRTVDVVDARHTLAAVRHVIRIAGKRTGRALALGDVIVADANRLWAAAQVFAGRTTLARSRRIDEFALLRFRAFGRRGALVAAHHLATDSILRIAFEAGQTLAFAVEETNENEIRCHVEEPSRLRRHLPVVIGGHANRIDRTLEFIANR